MHSPHNVIEDRAGFFAGHMKKNRIRSVTKVILYDLDIPINCEGFDFLEIMIPKAYQMPVPINLQELFCDIVREHPEYSVKTIDNAIQKSIDKAWSNRFGGRWNLYFPEYILRREEAPTNKEFIKAIVFFMNMWQDAYEKEANEYEPA